MWRHVVYCMFFVGHSGNKIDGSLAADISERCRRNGTEILQVARGGFDVPHLPDRWPLAQGVPLGSQHIEGCKKYCNAFLQFGMMVGFRW